MGGDCSKFANTTTGIGLADQEVQVAAQASAYAGRAGRPKCGAR
jgi:hypothetical protein